MNWYRHPYSESRFFAFCALFQCFPLVLQKNCDKKFSSNKDFGLSIGVKVPITSSVSIGFAMSLRYKILIKLKCCSSVSNSLSKCSK